MSILVKDIMKTDVITVDPDLSLSQAAKILMTYRIGTLPVVEKGKLVGIFTNSDMNKCVSDNCNAFETKVRDVMTKKVLTVTLKTTVTEAAQLMTKYGIKKLPVVESGRLVGIVTVSDILVIEPTMISAVGKMVSFDPDNNVAG